MSEAGSADEALGRAEELLERLKATREELERWPPKRTPRRPSRP